MTSQDRSHYLLENIHETLKKINEKLEGHSSGPDLRFLNFKQTCEFLNMSESQLRKFVFEKRIPNRKYGKKLMFDKKDLLDWVERSSGRNSEARKSSFLY